MVVLLKPTRDVNKIERENIVNVYAIFLCFNLAFFLFLLFENVL